jgi:hypothetical protein
MNVRGDRLVEVAQQHLDRLLLLVRRDELEDGLLHLDTLEIVLALEQLADLRPLLARIAAAREPAHEGAHHVGVRVDLRALQQLPDLAVGVAGRLVRDQLRGALAHHDRLVRLDELRERLQQQLVGARGQPLEQLVLLGHRRRALQQLRELVGRCLCGLVVPRLDLGSFGRRCGRVCGRWCRRSWLGILDRQGAREKEGEHGTPDDSRRSVVSPGGFSAVRGRSPAWKTLPWATSCRSETKRSCFGTNGNPCAAPHVVARPARRMHCAPAQPQVT